ncbi:hypothetical protein ACQP1U_07160 [Actinomycetota bacterium]
MAEVDPGDDTITRWIVRHYRYDPERRERRHVVVVAYDNEAEYVARMDEVQRSIERRRQSGARVHPMEHASGTVHEPGYNAAARRARNAIRAIRRGVVPPDFG